MGTTRIQVTLTNEEVQSVRERAGHEPLASYLARIIRGGLAREERDDAELERDRRAYAARPGPGATLPAPAGGHRWLERWGADADLLEDDSCAYCGEQRPHSQEACESIARYRDG
jgi:hypothetical protein